MEPVKETAEEMFLQYLKMVKLEESNMAPGQLTEMRRCFYGALGMHSVLIMQVAPHPKRLNLVLNRIKTDVWRFWRGQIKGNGGNIFK